METSIDPLTPWVGILAGCLTTFSFLPQAIKTVKTRSTQDFSWAYLSLFTVGILLWNYYGWLRQDLAIVVANAVTLGFQLVIVGIKVSNDCFGARVKDPTAPKP